MKENYTQHPTRKYILQFYHSLKKINSAPNQWALEENLKSQMRYNLADMLISASWDHEQKT